MGLGFGLDSHRQLFGRTAAHMCFLLVALGRGGEVGSSAKLHGNPCQSLTLIEQPRLRTTNPLPLRELRVLIPGTLL